MEDLPKITSKEQQFIIHYLTDCEGNKSAAYRKAYDCKSSSERTIWTEASRVYSNPRVSLWIGHYKQILQKHVEEEIKYTRNDLFEELGRIQAKTEDNQKTVATALKCVELKAKASGLLKEDANNTASVVVNMGEIKKDGKSINLQVGEDVDTITGNTGYSEQTSTDNNGV